jgi:hypothetical protein
MRATSNNVKEEGAGVNNSKLIKTVNIILIICMLGLIITLMLGHSEAFEHIHKLVGLFFVVFVVIHIVQHWGWVKVNLIRDRD